jgi:peptidyl-prolyl cis-trans isomerase-like 1
MVFEDEFHPKLTHHKLGILTMANTGPNTNQSQFIITLSSCQSMDNKHSVFGEITSNEELLYKINREFAS